MKKDTGYTKICATCTHSTFLFPDDSCYCDIKGPVAEDGKCGKYYFDLLKMKPQAPYVPETEGQ